LELYFDLKTLMLGLVCGLAPTASLLPNAGHAKVTLDMTQITCASYLAMSPSQARVFSAWMSGWFNQITGSDDFARNITSVSQMLLRQPASDNYGGLGAFHPATSPERIHRGAFLNCAHNRLAFIFLAMVADDHFTFGKNANDPQRHFVTVRIDAVRKVLFPFHVKVPIFQDTTGCFSWVPFTTKGGSRHIFDMHQI
jgi:HdeA/HdeB family